MWFPSLSCGTLKPSGEINSGIRMASNPLLAADTLDSFSFLCETFVTDKVSRLRQ